MADKCCSSNSHDDKDEQVSKSCCDSNHDNDKGEQASKSCCDSTNHNADDEQLGKGCCSSTTISKTANNSNSTCCSGGSKQTFIPLEDISANHINSNKKEPVKFQMSYRIFGMDCAACAKTIEKGLVTLPEISTVQVNFSTAKMQVSADSSQALLPIERTVKKLGFTAEPIQQNNHLKTYDVVGMDCSSCAKSIEKHLMSLPTVSTAIVNFSIGKMKVEHVGTSDEIISEVSKIGFQASLVENRMSSKSKQKQSKTENKIIIFSGILIALGFIGSYMALPEWLSNLFYGIAMVVSGYKPVRSAFYAIKSRSLDMNVLMSGAAIGAVLIGEWLEGATVVWLFAIGNYLQTKSIERTRDSISNLMDLAPPEAWVKVGTSIEKKPVEEIVLGQIIVIKPGEKIPLDGEILVGESSINQAPITGESIPVDKQIGDIVYAGTINEHGTLEVKVTKLVADTTIAKIIHLVEEAQEKKAPTEAFVDKFASIYTPIVFISALALIIIPPLFGFGTAGEWFYKGLELLVVACPCALVISTPVAIVSAIGNAAKNGVLIKGGTFLEIAGKIDAVAFDKTGTLTEGKPTVSDVQVEEISEVELLSIALTLEEYSTHPIAKAITNYVVEHNIEKKIGTDFKNIVGKGVQAKIGESIYYAGNVKLFEELGVPLTMLNEKINEIQNNGKTVVLIGTEKQMLGLISVSDKIRSSTVSTLNLLKQNNVNQTVMLTGDNDGAAKMIASEANVGRYFANLLPEDKVKAIQKLQNEGYTVAMVGDGINDAPALATANLGIAMGGAGTDTAMETADIVLMADNLDKLPHTIKLSKKALMIIKQNIIFSIIIKVIALVMIFPGWLTLWLAVLSDTGAALIVILNSLRLLRTK
ncbi:heavy metal translocating P-type ATPase [Lysinibacillus cavernae]|uniref:heavy metal translocating P-type ATPase n=1 Tax=Lysinibacillus cavernae TaxID=2666135 RepID=UPI0012D8E98D|nr:heavy metal translocating P-type ATPase [Lysinibacillus cavernae]